MLSKAERRLLERLAIFRSGWTLEAAEAVCAGPGVAHAAVLDLLARLTRKSLVLAEAQTDDAERHTLLESIREYARQKLATRGAVESTTPRGLHADFYASRAQQLAAIRAPASAQWALAIG